MMEPMNATTLLIREAPLQIQYKGRTGTFHCRVYFDLALNYTLVIEPQESLNQICQGMSQEDSFLVTFHDSVEPTECYATSSSLRIGGDHSGHFFRLSPRRSNLILRSGVPLVRIEAGILNFAHYLLTGRPEGQHFELRHGDWLYSFVPVDDQIYLYPPHIQTEEYAFTHHVTIRRLEGTAFSPEDAQLQLDLLGDFLTF